MLSPVTSFKAILFFQKNIFKKFGYLPNIYFSHFSLFIDRCNISCLKKRWKQRWFYWTIYHHHWFGQLNFHLPNSWQVDQKTRQETRGRAKFCMSIENFDQPRVFSYILFNPFFEVENTRSRDISSSLVFSSYLPLILFYILWCTAQNMRA